MVTLEPEMSTPSRLWLSSAVTRSGELSRHLKCLRRRVHSRVRQVSVPQIYRRPESVGKSSVVDAAIAAVKKC